MEINKIINATLAILLRKKLYLLVFKKAQENLMENIKNSNKNNGMANLLISGKSGHKYLEVKPSNEASYKPRNKLNPK